MKGDTGPALPPVDPGAGPGSAPRRECQLLARRRFDEAATAARPVVLTADECLGLLGAAEPGPHVEVVIEDTGCGLSAEARQRLLAEPFFTTKARQRGYGLAVAYGILAAHRGALAVEPAADGT